MPLGLKALPVENPSERLRSSAILAFVGLVPVWFFGGVIWYVSVVLLRRWHSIVYVAGAPLAPGMYLANAIYAGGMDDPLWVLLVLSDAACRYNVYWGYATCNPH